MRRLHCAVLLVVVVSCLSQAAAQVNIAFEKAAVSDGVWMGTVSGDVTGRLVTLMVAADQSRPVWEVDFYWIVLADDPGRSFVARLTGTLDSGSGEVAMSGVVNEGYLAGARVDESGHLVDATTSRFEGTIRLAAAPADNASSCGEGGSMDGYPWDDASSCSSPPATARAAAGTTQPAGDACGEGGSMDGYPWDDASRCSPRRP
jgi:hypothetical protein